jgi:hypothetical protein
MFPKDQENWIMDAIREVPLESLLKSLSVEPELHRLCLGVRRGEGVKLELYGMTAAPGESGVDAAEDTPQLVPCHVVVHIRLKRVRGKEAVQLVVEAPSCVSIGRTVRSPDVVSAV